MSVHTQQILARLLLRLTGRVLLLPIKWTIKRGNWVETHSVSYSVHHHWHNVKQKRPVLIKQAKICYVWAELKTHWHWDVCRLFSDLSCLFFDFFFRFRSHFRLVWLGSVLRETYQRRCRWTARTVPGRRRTLSAAPGLSALRLLPTFRLQLKISHENLN